MCTSVIILYVRILIKRIEKDTFKIYMAVYNLFLGYEKKFKTNKGNKSRQKKKTNLSIHIFFK